MLGLHFSAESASLRRPLAGASATELDLRIFSERAYYLTVIPGHSVIVTDAHTELVAQASLNHKITRCRALRIGKILGATNLFRDGI